MTLLQARGLTKEFGRDDAGVRAVDEIDLDVESGETVAVVGPSGCGKSTLLHMLGGLERPTRGEVRLDGRRLDRLTETGLAKLRRHAIGFVFQAFQLVDELTARENVELPALLAGIAPRSARERADALLDRVGLADRAGHLPAALSGGQRQRVAVARALIGTPRVVLADEPTGNLDSAATADVLRLFTALRAEGQTLVIVTHSARAAAIADRVITMRDGVLVGQTHVAGTDAGTAAALAGLSGLSEPSGLSGLSGLSAEAGPPDEADLPGPSDLPDEAGLRGPAGRSGWGV
jgi:putative ABC transport system ATP-binding protein